MSLPREGPALRTVFLLTLVVMTSAVGAAQHHNDTSHSDALQDNKTVHGNETVHHDETMHHNQTVHRNGTDHQEPHEDGMHDGHSPSRAWTVGDTAWTAVHLVGILIGLLLLNYSWDMWKGAGTGSAIGETGRYVAAGTAVFIAAMVGMEARHAFGLNLWYFARTAKVRELWDMMLLDVTITLYAVAYRKLTTDLRGDQE
ncbi:MAG: hypothetical protein ABEK01_01265 [Candidatus Nanohaloarchaea archaeon]